MHDYTTIYRLLHAPHILQAIISFAEFHTYYNNMEEIQFSRYIPGSIYAQINRIIGPR